MPETKRCFFISGSWGVSANSDRLDALASRLVALGHQVIIILDHQEVSLPFDSKNPAYFTWPSYRPTHLKDAIFLRKLIKRYQPDCLISQFGSVNLMTLVGWSMRVPLRMARYETASRAIEVDTNLSKQKMRWLRLRERWILGFATHILANSNAASEDAQKLYKIPSRKLHVFYNYLIDPNVGPKEKEFLSTDPYRIVCVGRFNHSKGQDILIRALSLLPESLPLSLEFVGVGETLPACMTLAEELGVRERCQFSGSVPHDQVFRKFASASCSVVPSRGEAFGYICVESLAVGTPVIGSRVGGIPEIVRDGLDGFLFTPDDPRDLADKLNHFLSPSVNHFDMQQNARHRFYDGFEADKVLKQQITWLLDQMRNIP